MAKPNMLTPMPSIWWKLLKSKLNNNFGVNVSGPEFAPWAGQTFPTAADFTYLRSKGVGSVRLPIAWESIQPTLSAALDPTYLANVKTAIANAYARGISTVVAIENSGGYASQAKWTTTVAYAGNSGVVATGVNILGDGTLTTTVFADLMTRLSTALKGLSGYVGLSIMSEPWPTIGVNILSPPNYFAPNNGPFSAWYTFSSSVVTRQATGSNPLGAGYGPSWTVTSGTGFGAIALDKTLTASQYTASIWARSAASTPMLISFGGLTSANIPLTPSWTRVSFTGVAAAGASTVVFQLNSGAGATIELANAQFELAASPSTYVSNPYLVFAQAGINAVRAVDSTVPIYVCGGGAFGLAAFWDQWNYEQATLTGGGLVHEAHQFWDGAQGKGGGGAYSGSYASYSITASTGSACLTPFTSWLSAQSLTGYLGSFGIPNGADQASWLLVQANALTALRAANLKAAGWFYGANGAFAGSSLNLAPVNNDARLLQLLAA